MITHYIISVCRVCASEALEPLLSLGNQKVIDFPKDPEEYHKPIVPLELVICGHCLTVQLRHTTNPKFLYDTFWYRSGISEVMRSALLDVVVKSSEKVGLREGDVVCDIGANDGTMLSMFPEKVITVGFDPSNIIDSEEALHNMTFAVHNYFNREDAVKIASKTGKFFKLITAIAMFYDLEDPATFLYDVRSMLTEDGMIVIQMNYLLSMMKNNAFDNIVHEHLTYYSLTSLRWLLHKCGLEIVDVETNEINGGSIRVYAKRGPISYRELPHGSFDRIKNLLDEEKEYGLDHVQTYKNFGKRISKILTTLQKYIIDISVKGIPVYAYGASTRGSTLLQSVQLPLAGIAERDKNKIGRLMVADWLKIYDEDYVRSRCKYMLVLPWHFESGIVEREREWLNNGGTLIFPLGGENNGPHIVTKDGTQNLLEEKEHGHMATTSTKS